MGSDLASYPGQRNDLAEDGRPTDSDKLLDTGLNRTFLTTTVPYD